MTRRAVLLAALGLLAFASTAQAHRRCSHWTIRSGRHVIQLECVPRGATATVQVGRRTFVRHAPGHTGRVCVISSYVFGYRDVTVDVGPLPVGGRVSVLIDGEGGGTSC